MDRDLAGRVAVVTGSARNIGRAIARGLAEAGASLRLLPVEAADRLAAAGILAPGRPLTFAHPIVRAAVYGELSGAERAAGHRRAAELLDAIAHTLRLWLLGQLVAMVTVGTLATIALWVLDVPSPLALGLIAGLTEFIPILGPFMAAVPAILAALLVDPMKAVHVAIAYLVVQQVENHILQPLVQKEVVALPPLLTIFATVTFGLIFGPLGLLLATPLAVVALVAVRMLYVEDVLDSGEEDVGASSQRVPSDRGAVRNRRVKDRPVP
jgi:hypothetical protein